MQAMANLAWGQKKNPKAQREGACTWLATAATSSNPKNPPQTLEEPSVNQIAKTSTHHLEVLMSVHALSRALRAIRGGMCKGEVKGE